MPKRKENSLTKKMVYTHDEKRRRKTKTKSIA
jgi:hypothetical protein